MTDAGFFRGTSADQDNRFANKQKKLLKELNFSPVLNTKLSTAKLDIVKLRPWIDEKIKTILEKDDELLSESIYEHLAEKEPKDGKDILVLITGFVEESKASKFMEELWTKLLDLNDNSNGVNKASADQESSEKKNDKSHSAGDEATQVKDDKPDRNEDRKEEQRQRGSRHSSKSSRSVSPPSRSISKSPGNHRLDEHSRGRPRRRIQNEDEANDPKREKRSRSRSSSNSKSPGKDRSNDNRGNRRGRSRSASSTRHRSGSRSVSRSRSRSRSRSYSRSRSASASGSRSRSRSPSPRNRPRSPRRRSRSPYSHRARRSSSISRGYRQRSRSPGRRGRGFMGRGPYRGSFYSGGYNERRRGSGPSFSRRRSPWGRRRFSPRRGSPLYSPRRGRSPSPYGRRSRSRSPIQHNPGLVAHRNVSPPRSHFSGPSNDMTVGRNMMPIRQDMHRSMLPLPNRSPRGFMDHRGYGDNSMIMARPPSPPGHPLMNKQSDLPLQSSHNPFSSIQQPGSSGMGPYSPPSSSHSRKKHKKEKKHRKHKKSKKHRSVSPEKKKKHKKHKKAKKHKSH